MESQHLTQEQVSRVLGQVSDTSAIREILASGATREDLLRAVIEVEYEDEYGESFRDPTTETLINELKRLIRLALDDDQNHFVRGYD
jgi:hypothetical protein